MDEAGEPPRFRDISNLKTPKRPPPRSDFQSPKFFTAQKQTPRTCSKFRTQPSMLTSSSSRSVHYRPSIAPPSSARSRKKSAVARKLEAFELEQSQSSRKEQIRKEQSLRSLAKSLTVWLNFLFENPASCGCDVSIAGDTIGDVGSNTLQVNGKRDNRPGITVGIDGAWRVPKRQRHLWWPGVCACGPSDDSTNKGFDICNLKFTNLEDSLKDVCSFEDLKQRMRVYLSLKSFQEIFEVMTQVTKNIDDGRLKMKPHCPIVTDVGLKEKATEIIMCYNPVWLRVGLYVIFGGDSLVSNQNVYCEQEVMFLKMIIEKQFFSNPGLAKAYAYNKMVDGLYRPGYYERLGNMILKRLLLLALLLDRMKCQTCLPLEYGIDGLDGGSPLLFKAGSYIKSSGHLICEFLSSDVMHGEGNLLAHLVVVGYNVFHQQVPLVECDFRVRDLFVDIQDGHRLCRVIQLLQHDSSILTRIVVPSDNQKKKLANCGVALKYLKQAGVSLYDEDEMMIVEDDIANGDKELTVSLLWNIFVSWQLPLLVDKMSLVEEINKMRGSPMDDSSTINSTPLELLFTWIQAVCKNYDCGINNYPSLIEGKAIWCLLDHYFQRELNCACYQKVPDNTIGKQSIISALDDPDAAHNFILSQKLTALLGNFPEVLQVSDLLEYNGASNERSVVILLVFLANQLFVKKNVDHLNFHKLLGCNCQSPDKKHSLIRKTLFTSETNQRLEESAGYQNEDAARKFKAVQSWWREMTERNHKCVTRPTIPSIHVQRENAAKFIQRYCHGWLARRDFLSVRDAAIKIQSFLRGVKYQKAFISRKFAATEIQRYVRGHLTRNKLLGASYLRGVIPIVCATQLTGFSTFQLKIFFSSVLKVQRWWKNIFLQRLKRKSAVIIQSHMRSYRVRQKAKLQRHAIIVIQSHCRAWLLRRDFLIQREAALQIQCVFRRMKCQKAFICEKTATIRIQQFIREQMNQRKSSFPPVMSSCCIRSTPCCRSLQLNSLLRLQKWWKGVLIVRLETKSALIIQSHLRGWMARRKVAFRRRCVLLIQAYWKGYVVRKELRGQLLDLRQRVQNSAKNVDDSKRIINRLLTAISELLKMKSVSGILHTCATLDMTTSHSLKCCEALVSAGSIDILLKLIRSVSRSIPDQEVLKHTLSTLRNLARYPHLLEKLINQSSLETIMLQLLRNKDEGFFIASELLKKILASQKGKQAIRKSPALLKRLHTLVEELTRRVGHERRSMKGHNLLAKESTERRLEEASELLKLANSGT